MPQNYTGSTAGITARQNATISEPLGSDVRNATSVVTPLRTLTNLVQYLMQKAGVIDTASTWTAQQTFGGGVKMTDGALELVRAGLQGIWKSGGTLQAGTSDANNVELYRNGAVMLALTPDGVTLNTNALIGIARAVLGSLTADPSTLLDGSLWHRSDLAKVRARVAGVTENLATESYARAYADGVQFAAPTITRPTLDAGWTAHAGGQALGYWMDRNRVVHLVGGATRGSGGVLFTLPAGYRPAATRQLLGANPTAGTVPIVQIAASGAVTLFSAASSGDSLFFDGVTLLAEQ